MPIEKISPALDAIIDTNAPIAEHGSGFGGFGRSRRGPAMVERRRLPAVQRHSQQPPDAVHPRARALPWRQSR